MRKLRDTLRSRQVVWLFAVLLINALLLLYAGAIDVSAWTALEEGGLDIMEAAGTAPGDLAAKKAYLQNHLTWRNKSGSTMTASDPVIVDSNSITVVSAASAADGMTIAESLSSEGGPHYVMVGYSEAQGDTLTGTLVGTDQYGSSQTETVTTAATGLCLKSSKLWKTITTVNMANLSGNVQVYAYPMNGIIAATSDVTSCIGVTTESIADNAEGEVATRGFVTYARVRGAAIIPGDALSCAGSGYLDEDSTAPVAIALEPSISASADEEIRVLLTVAND